MPTYLVTIAGVDHDLLLDGVDIRLVANGVDTLLGRVASIGGSPYYRPDIDDEVIVTEDAVAIFGGFITATREMGLGGPNLDQIVTEIAASGYAEITQRRHITYSVAGGSPATTLKSVLQDLIASDWGNDGMILSGSQDDGPGLPVMEFLDAVGKDILDKLAQATGRVWRVNESNELRMWAPGTIAAPFDIDVADLPAKYFGDLIPSKTRLDGYANRVIVVGETITEIDRVETFISDGVTTVFTPEYRIIGMRPGQVAVSNLPTLQPSATLYESIARAPVGSPATQWAVDVEANTFERLAGALPAGAEIRITFDGQFTPRAQSDDLSEQGSPPRVRDKVIRAPVRTQADAQSLADQILPDAVKAKQTRVSYSTREVAALFPGQTQSVDAPERELSGDFLITDVGIRNNPDEIRLIREVTNNQGQIVTTDYRNLWAQMVSGTGPGNINAGSSLGNTGPVIQSATSGTGTSSAFSVPPDDTWVFFNEKQWLGARAGFRWLYENQENFLLGIPGAATVANTGIGAYPATIRYYRIQWLTAGATVTAQSELGPSVSFTPSGSGTAARVTRPSPPGAATHWRLYASADDVTFHNQTTLAIATTFFDDSVNPASYTGVSPSPAGTYLRREQLLLTGSRENEFQESLLNLRSLTSGGDVSGAMGAIPWSSDYSGELFFGCEYVNGQYIARATSCLFLFLQSPDAFLVLYPGQTPGSPAVFTEHVTFTMNGSTSETAKGDFGFFSSGISAAHMDKIVLSDSNTDRTLGVIIAIADAISGTAKGLTFQMGNTSRMIRFDGVGSNVTFT